MMLSAVSYHGKIFTITSLQALSLEFFHSCPPLSEHKVLGIGELRETGMLIYLAWFVLRGRASCPACLHTL